MTRLACLRIVVLSSAVLAVTAARTARASDPVSVYVAASRVDTMPDDASATTVAIHGAFLLIQSDGTYLPPQCGYMYFKCPAGSEAMCRLQWKDVRTVGTGTNTCAGFGTLLMTTKATLRSEGTLLASPDDWDLGMGISTGVSVGNQCPGAKAMACAKPMGSGGAGGGGVGIGGNDGAGGVPGTGTGGATGAGGASGATGTAGTPGDSPGTAGTNGGAGTTGHAGTFGTTGTAGKSGSGGGWCAVQPGGSDARALPIVGLLVAAMLLRRRRR